MFKNRDKYVDMIQRLDTSKQKRYWESDAFATENAMSKNWVQICGRDSKFGCVYKDMKLGI